MLSLFNGFSTIPIPTSADDNYRLSPERVTEEIARGTSVLLTSNPRNPTGQVSISMPLIGHAVQAARMLKQSGHAN